MGNCVKCLGLKILFILQILKIEFRIIIYNCIFCVFLLLCVLSVFFNKNVLRFSKYFYFEVYIVIICNVYIY